METKRDPQCEIIVECCQNHNGRWQVLDRMVRSAVDAGAKYIKMQSIWAADLTRRDRFEAGDPERTPFPVIKRPYDPEYNRLKGLELSLREHEQFVQLCEQLGAVPMTTVFATHRLETVKALGFEWLKVASYDCGSRRLLDLAKDLFSHIVVSTGASHDDEIAECVSLLGPRLAGLLHCVTVYPTPLELANLSRLEWLRQFTPRVGYSDHSKPEDTGLLAAKWAILLGARWVERHYTVLPRSETKDGPVSITPGELGELIRFAASPQETEPLREVKRLVLGKPTRTLTAVELSNRDYYRGRFAEVLEDRVVYNFE